MELDHPTTLPMVRRRFRHVFVLCTGRCGSVTFAKACEHFTNYTVGHETNRATGSARLEYHAGHIEVDNRLAWFLGGLETRYGDDAFYVHLVRDDAKVAASYDRRWHHHGSLIRGFDEGICRHEQPGAETAADLVATINANIRAFLRHKPHAITGDIDEVASWLPRFAAQIGAEGDFEAALAEFDSRHNASAAGADCATDTTEPSRSRESLPVVRLKQRNEVLAAELARLRGKLRRARRTSWVLAAPWILATAPLALPILWFTNRDRLRLTRVKPPLRHGWPQWLSFRRRTHRTVIYDAFLAYRAEGPERANAILNRAGRTCPAGAKELFRAMSARSDAEWLAATNAWAAIASLPEISLKPGTEPRFERLQLTAAEPVLSRDRVSVIMPAFNARRMIEHAARSILTQSWRNLELIIVDDCSSDGTAEVAERLAAEDPRVRVLRNPANVGPYVSKNRALLVATGSYVTGHDADDIAIPTRIADQMNPILDNASYSASIGYMVRLDRNGTFSYPAKICKSSYDGVTRLAMISLLIERKLLLDRVGAWDSVRFGADSEMLARVTAMLGPRLQEIRKVLMLCLNAEGSLTNNASHGINVWEGVSPIRKAYREAWAAWHAGTRVDERRLPFPHLERRFAAPEGMLVSAAAIKAVTEADGLGVRRQAA